MPWYVYLAIKQLFPAGKSVSFFAVMAIVGVMLGVMVLVVVQSVMNGFSQKIQETMNDTMGDIRIQSHEIIYSWEKVVDLLDGLDFVEASTPYAEGMLMLKHRNKPAFPLVRGIEVSREINVVPLESFMIGGDLDDLDDMSILVSSGLARALNAQVGSELEVYTPYMIEALKKDEVLLPRELEVVGLFETGMTKIDDNMVLVSRRLMQDVYGLHKGVHGFTVKLTGGANLDKSVARIQELMGPEYQVLSWLDREKDLLFVLKLEKTMMFFIIIFIILVASFSIASSLMTTVVRKTREIGLLGALGARSSRIAFTFCFQGFVIGVVGTILGILGAMLAIHYRNDIVHWLGAITNRDDLVAQFYMFSDIPSHYMLSDFIIISICSLFIATAAGFVPAMYAARLKPSEALRNE